MMVYANILYRRPHFCVTGWFVGFDSEQWFGSVYVVVYTCQITLVFESESSVRHLVLYHRLLRFHHDHGVTTG